MERKTTTQVWRLVAGFVATIYCPKAIAEMALFFNKGKGNPLHWVAVGLAAVMVWIVMRLYAGYERGDRLTMMLMVFSSICLVFTVSSDLSRAFNAFALSMGAAALVGAVRSVLNYPAVRWEVVMLRVDGIRYACVVWLFNYLHISTGGSYQRNDWWIPFGGIVLTCLLNWRATQARKQRDVPGRKSPVGWIRWILGFAIGGTLINWSIGSADSLALGLAISVYAVLFIRETPDLKTFTSEAVGVLGSGAATTLQVALMKTEVVTALPLLNLIGFLTYGVGCIAVLKWHAEDRPVIQKFHWWLTRKMV